MELLWRERHAELSKLDVTLRTIAGFFGMAPQTARVATLASKDELSKIIFGGIFDPRYLMARLEERLQKIRDEKRTMDRVKQMG